ncbi:MAG: glycosyltransferase family 4 protein [Candidatus Pacebacteria bacterium]|nr:glycosyltransferase family 4 protein [Candidatus Paceibacterota bacterium]NUQ57071.1 glycosyltransferase family 4 protein [Candidatus Paceibacter sp.]
MKILYLTDEFPPENFGGAGIVAYDFAKAVAKTGHKVFVITTTRNRSLEGESLFEGLKVFRLYSNYPIFLRHYISVYNPFLVFKIKKILKEIEPGVVHAHNIHSDISYHSLKLAKKTGCKVFLTAHDTMLVSYDKNYFPCGEKNFRITAWRNIKIAGKRYNPFRNFFIKKYLNYTDKIFAISQALKEFLAQNGVDSVVLHNGVNIEDWVKPAPEKIMDFRKKYGVEGKKIILFGGRFSGAKGGRQILQAFSWLVKNCPVEKAVLLAVGRKNQYAEKMAVLTKKLAIDDKILFTGWLGREEIKAAFFVSDVCVTPSVYFDPFNLFNIEAMAAGKPVVGTCFGGTPEIVVDGQTGYIANPLNHEEFGKKICDILSDKNKAEIFGKNGRKRAEEFFSLQKQTEKLISRYQIK